MDPTVWIFEPFRWLWAMFNDRPVVVVMLLAAFIVCATMAAQLLGDKRDRTP